MFGDRPLPEVTGEAGLGGGGAEFVVVYVVVGAGGGDAGVVYEATGEIEADQLAAAYDFGVTDAVGAKGWQICLPAAAGEHLTQGGGLQLCWGVPSSPTDKEPGDGKRPFCQPQAA